VGRFHQKEAIGFVEKKISHSENKSIYYLSAILSHINGNCNISEPKSESRFVRYIIKSNASNSQYVNDLYNI